MTYTYKTKGTCSTNIELEVEDIVAYNLKVIDKLALVIALAWRLLTT